MSDTLTTASASAADRRLAFEAQLREDAEQLFSTLCEGEGEHSEALDVGLILAAFRHLLSWAVRDAPPRGAPEVTAEQKLEKALIALRAIKRTCPCDPDTSREFNAAWGLLEAAVYQE